MAAVPGVLQDTGFSVGHAGTEDLDTAANERDPLEPDLGVLEFSMSDPNGTRSNAQ